MTAAAEPSLTAAEFSMVRDYFYRQTGIRFDDAKRYFVDRRVLDRMVATESASFRSYFSLLRFGPPDELQRLTNSLTINETYFFREAYQFRALVRSILPEVIARHDRRQPIRLWVLPSSSGEEPYSIALTLLEEWPGLAEWDVEIIASDIDTAILDEARRGRYGDRAVAHVPPAMLDRYFTRDGDHWQLDATVREAVTFTRVNLTDAAEMAAMRDIDIVFCRNLLIYFDDRSRRTAAEHFFEAMSPGGFICLGHSESMSRISPLFRPRAFTDAIVYQKPLEAR